MHRGAIKGERGSTGVWGEEPTGWVRSVAGQEKEESGVMPEVPWMGSRFPRQEHAEQIESGVLRKQPHGGRA